MMVCETSSSRVTNHTPQSHVIHHHITTTTAQGWPSTLARETPAITLPDLTRGGRDLSGEMGDSLAVLVERNAEDVMVWRCPELPASLAEQPKAKPPSAPLFAQLSQSQRFHTRWGKRNCAKVMREVQAQRRGIVKVCVCVCVCVCV